MNFDNIKNDIKQNLNILIELLNDAGANVQIKEAGKRKAIGRCIFHGGDGLNLHILQEDDGYHFKCHTKCNIYGDIFDLLEHTEGISFKNDKYETLKFLNDRFNLGYDLKPDKATNFKKYIETKNNTLESPKYGLCKYENIYFYRDVDGNPIMCKIKYRSIENPSKKEFRTYALVDKGEYYQRGTSQDFSNLNKTIYNFPKVHKAISEGKNIYFVEGEKDADNLNRLGLVATTVYSKVNKWEHNYSRQLYGANIVFIGDTGEAGEKFKKMVLDNVSPTASSFKIVTLNGIDELGDNKDVTDWLEAGHTKEELLNIVNRTLDIKNVHELQQDHEGIYYISIKTKVDKDTGKEYEVSRKKVYITNFIIKEANIYRSVDDDNQKIELSIVSNLGKKGTIIADARMLFIDLKTFRKELGVDYIFSGKGDLLPRLQMWILKYFVNKDIANFTITGIREIKGENVLVTNHGLLRADGSFDTSTKAIDNDIHDMNFEGMNPLDKNEADILMKHLFNFNNKRIVYNVLGLASAQLLNSFVRNSNNRVDNIPILQNIGESNSGKSKSFSIIRGMLNINSKPLSYSNLTDFTLMRAFSMTYLPLLIDELKPSKNTLYKLNMLTNHIQNSTEGYKAEKGRKDLTTKKFNYLACLMLSGEESIEVNATINRSNISTYTRANFTDEGSDAIDFLVRDSEGSYSLKRFSLSLYTFILKKYNIDILVDEYKEIKDKFKAIPDDRIRNTAIYTYLGLINLVNVFKTLGVDTDKYVNLEEARHLIESNMFDEIMDINGEKQVSEYEEILLLVDKLAGSSDLSVLLSHNEHYKLDGNIVAFDFGDIWDRLNLYTSKYDKNRNIMSKNSFLKQLRKSVYISKNDSGKAYSLIRFKKTVYTKNGDRVEESKPVRAYLLRKDKLQDLGMCNIVPMKEIDNIKHSDNVIHLNHGLVKEEEEKWMSWDDIYNS